MSVVDLKMNKLLQTVSLYNEEITSVAINEKQDSIVAGFKDGMIKIISMGKGEFEARES